MPCTDPYQAEDREKANERLQAATRAACDLASATRRYCPGAQLLLQPETLTWLAQHDADDRRRALQEMNRVESERMRQAALEKLSPEERRLLGIYS